MKSTLIILRGNSGSGKTTIANKLQKHLGEKTLLISQDVVRRNMLNVKDTSENLSINLIKKIASYGNEFCPFVIIEGILASKRYKHMLLELMDIFDNNGLIYYFDISFEETLTRHLERTKKMNLVKKKCENGGLKEIFLMSLMKNCFLNL